MKLKGGIGKWSFMKNLKNVGGAVAITFIKALDSAERMKEVFYIRGYTIGNIKLEKEQNSIWNLYPVILSVFTFLLYFFL
jgi:cobalt/nickel transport system permease protein